MEPAISDYNKRLILISVIQLNGRHCISIKRMIFFSFRSFINIKRPIFLGFCSFINATIYLFRFDPMSSILMRGGDTAGEKKKYHDALHTQVAYKHEKNIQRRKDDQVLVLVVAVVVVDGVAVVHF